jgi:hypothetical protein
MNKEVHKNLNAYRASNSTEYTGSKDGCIANKKLKFQSKCRYEVTNDLTFKLHLDQS